MSDLPRLEISRRGVLAGTAMLSASPAIPARAAPVQNEPAPLMPVRFKVNGKDRQLSLDPRTTLLDAAARTPAPHRHQEGLRPRPVRRLHGHRQRPNGSIPA
jgi:hypothetical protein